jgi:hypothetical protein
VIDRGLDVAERGILNRARERVEELVAGYLRPEISSEREQEMLKFAEREGRKAGLQGLPGIVASECATR